MLKKMNDPIERERKKNGNSKNGRQRNLIWEIFAECKVVPALALADKGQRHTRAPG